MLHFGDGEAIIHILGGHGGASSLLSPTDNIKLNARIKG